jgi:hypothetical protein
LSYISGPGKYRADRLLYIEAETSRPNEGSKELSKNKVNAQTVGGFISQNCLLRVGFSGRLTIPRTGEEALEA